jgi:hypothetical protein
LKPLLLSRGAQANTAGADGREALDLASHVAMTNCANPDSVGAPFDLYSQVSVAGDLVSVAGQVGVDRDSQVWDRT